MCTIFYPLSDQSNSVANLKSSVMWLNFWVHNFRDSEIEFVNCLDLDLETNNLFELPL